MYGSAAGNILVFCAILQISSTGPTATRSIIARQQKSPPPPYKCSEDEVSITVKCHPKPARDRFEPSTSNRSMCCSFGLYNSSHHRGPCDDTPMSNLLHNLCPSSGGKVPACLKYHLQSCEGSTLSLLCDVNLTCNDRVRWRRLSDDRITKGRSLQLSNVQRRDIGSYGCEVTDYFGKLRLRGQVTLNVEFPPVILVPNQSLSTVSDQLECMTEANPPASITWYKDDLLLTADWYSISSETANCTTWSQVQLNSHRNFSSSASHLYENYTCMATNLHGQTSVTLLFSAPSDVETMDGVSVAKRRFNVTGFIVGMLPPLFISFYIILKLGYRSRYAEERGEDDGFREEPYFISY